MKILRNNVGASIARPHTNANGVTVIALIITIIVTLILATVAINVGTGEIEESRRVSFVSYMQTIQSKVDFIVNYDEYKNYGQELNYVHKTKLQNILNNDIEDLLTTADSETLRYFDSSYIASDLELENIDDEIVVDFSTREVISLNGIEYEDKMYHTQYFLPGGQKLKYQTEEVDRSLSLGSISPNIDGLNSTFTITNIGITNGTLSYGKRDASNVIKWTIITNYTKSGETITTTNITESGTYYFKLMDNVTGEDNGENKENYPFVEIRLTNKPKLEENFVLYDEIYNYSDLKDSTKWAFATDTTDEANLVYYVWIPRYAYQLNEDKTLKELQFLRGTSDITTSGGYINASEWKVPDAFTKEGVQKTGVWVQVDTPNKDEVDIIDILETGIIL